MTTYAPPNQFAHGDFPTAANLDLIKDALDAIAEIVTDGTTPVAGEALPRLNYAVYWNREKDSYIAGQANKNSDFYLVHRQRYLHYKSTGTVEDVAGIEDATSLVNENTYNVYDLDSITWLTYGMVYRVAGVDFCMEDVDP